MFAQNQQNGVEILNNGFQNVEVLQEDTVFEGIQLTKTKGKHGRGEILKRTGLACGIVLKHPMEKTLYIAGDTVCCDAVKRVIDTYAPDIIVVNAGDNQFFEGGSLIMGKDDVYEVCKVAPNGK